jgi:hypothetical protein
MHDRWEDYGIPKNTRNAEYDEINHKPYIKGDQSFPYSYGIETSTKNIKI